MIDIIILFFLLKRIGRLANEKGVSPTKWKIFAVLSWFIFEGIGVDFALAWSGFTEIKNINQATNVILNNPGIVLFGLFCGFGGYLLVRLILERKVSKEG